MIHVSLLVFHCNIPPLRNKYVNWVHTSGLCNVSSQLPKQMNAVSYATGLSKNMKAVVQCIYKGHLCPQGLTSLCNVSWLLLWNTLCWNLSCYQAQGQLWTKNPKAKLATVNIPLLNIQDFFSKCRYVVNLSYARRLMSSCSLQTLLQLVLLSISSMQVSTKPMSISRFYLGSNPSNAQPSGRLQD